MNNIALPNLLNEDINSVTLCSNCPLYIEFDIREPIDKLYILLLEREGTSFLASFNASPFIIAVLPIPGSPHNRTLFLLLLAIVFIMASSSLSLPIIGSISPSIAICVKSTQVSSIILSGFLGFFLLLSSSLFDLEASAAIDPVHNNSIQSFLIVSTSTS